MQKLNFPQRISRSTAIFAGLLFSFVAMACSEDVDPAENGEGDCLSGEVWNPVTNRCDRVGTSDGDTDGDFDGDSDADTGIGGEDTGDGDSDPIGPIDCEGFDCTQVSCPVGQMPTSITGVVTIPSGELPLPDVNVYIPREPLQPIVDGASCERCEDQFPLMPVTSTTTDINGEFRLINVPAGNDIPLVIEVGKWRKKVAIPLVEPCVENPIPDPSLTRLPRSRHEGDMPRMALTTGGWDAMECLLRKIGISANEITSDQGDGRIHLFAGRGGTNRFHESLHGGASFTPSHEWWDDLDNLLPYDIVIHSCEGESFPNDKPEVARDALRDFTELGGRVFLSHWHNVWLNEGPSDFQSVANWESTFTNATVGHIDTSFEKGEMLRDWMFATGTTPEGQLPIQEARATIQSINEELAQQWIWIDSNRTQYFTFNTPIDEEPEEQCGRVVFSDIHVAAGDNSSPSHPFPTGCTSSGLTPQEKALIFMFFDLSRCIVPDGKKD